ncbi:MAG: nitroreductase [Acidimicrobiales bacterium]|jgi:nitroreductase
MELYDVMRSTFAAREFTNDPVPDEVLHRIFDNARFAPSGGNRQGQKVVVIRDAERKKQLGMLCDPALRVYDQQRQAGENPWNSVIPTKIDVEKARNTPSDILPFFRAMDKVPVVLIVVVNLEVVASTDKELDRIGVISGGSIYPLAWNILLSARNEGYGGTMTTLIASAEPQVKEMLDLGPHEAVAALIPLGKPVKQLTKLKRVAVDEYVVRETGTGEPFTL